MPKDPDILVDLTTARTDFEAELIVESLQAQGIFAKAFTVAGSMLQWEVAATQPMKIAVRRGDLDRAIAALRAIRAESVDIDWDEVDTGDASPELPREADHAGKLGGRESMLPPAADGRRHEPTAASLAAKGPTIALVLLGSALVVLLGLYMLGII